VKGHGAKLPRKKEQAIAALLNYSTVVEAAKAIGVAEVTLYRWLADPSFKETFRKAKALIVDQAITRLQQSALEAVNVLHDIMIDRETKASVRVSAAKAILDHTQRATENENLASRLDRLEAIVKENKK
jgi:hypothetical protein